MRRKRIAMRLPFGLLFAAIVIFGSGPAAVAATSAEAAGAIAAMLMQSAQAWNRGDLRTFMQTYENSPQTVYISSATVVHGYAQIRARYAGQYRPGHMGVLSVSDLAVRPLGSLYALATARWHLARPATQGGTVSGLFSLVVHRNATGWHIIADHTP